MPGMDMKGGGDRKDMPMPTPSAPSAPQPSPSGGHQSHQQ